jgi:tungstate transport system ATP-binding protein
MADPAPMTDAILPLSLTGVCYRAGGLNLLENISVTLRAGARTVILGPNGAGKTLLLRICHGLLTPSAGQVRWAAGGPGLPAAQAMVFQQPVLLRRSAAANVDYALKLRGLERRERARRVAEALALAGLTPLARRPARVLSGGERQRLALARAWAPRPQVLFLDEPTANLDPAATRAIEDALLAIHQGGTKIVMTTQDLHQARRMAEEVLFLHRGRLLESAPAAAFFSQPRSPEAQAFLRGELAW